MRYNNCRGNFGEIFIDYDYYRLIAIFNKSEQST
jgi:hypothetical protein